MKDMSEAISSAISLLDAQQHAHLGREWGALRHYLEQTEVRVAVLGPFNQGKSTLLNALLGGRHLPFDIIPTTGSAIFIRHGKVLEAKVGLRDGTCLRETGSSLLERFATLDGQRKMRGDVTSVEITLPHEMLEGMTIVDLPGTNDRSAQEELIKDELFYADAVIQVLNARQLFTLEEERKLEEWVIASGIRHVLFVLNFCNLLDAEDQAAVVERARLVVSRLSGKLSAQSRLYRVDALPALRSHMRGEGDELKQSGLPEFAHGLRSLTRELIANRAAHRSPRVQSFARKVSGSLEETLWEQRARLRCEEQRREAEDAKLAQNLSTLSGRFEKTSSVLKSALEESQLTKAHRAALIKALASDGFKPWLKDSFKPLMQARLSPLNDLIAEVCKLRREAKFGVDLPFPSAANLELPDEPEGLNEEGGGAVISGAVAGATLGTFLLPGVGTVVGALVGGLWGGSAKEEAQKRRAQAKAEYESEVEAAYEAAAEDYFKRFAKNGSAALRAAERRCRNLLTFTPTPATAEEKRLRQQVTLLQEAAGKLESTAQAASGGPA